jgi:transcriptional regulator with XRE-family HTH domain
VTDLAPTIAKRLRAARLAAGLSQQQVADELGTVQSYVSRLECGRHVPALRTLVAAAHACGTTASRLLEGVE